MGINLTRRNSIWRMAVLALLMICFAQLPARAQGTHALYQDIFIPPIGLAPDQSLRLTLFNPEGTPVRAQVRSHHPGGIVVALADGSVRAGTSHSFDIDRPNIPQPGEAGTGRIQLCASVRLTFSEAIRPVVMSMELLSITDGTSNTVFYNPYVTVDYPGRQVSPDGTSNTIFVGEIIPTAPGNSGGRNILIGGSTRDILMGMVPGQTLRVTLFNPKPQGADYIPSRIILFEESGREIAQIPEQIIPSGESRFFDIPAEAIPSASGAPAGRRQIRVRLEADGDPRVPALLLFSAEMMDTAGKTLYLLSGNQCLVFY